MQKVKTIVSLVLVGVTLLAAGCASHPSSSPSPKPSGSPSPSTAASTSKTTTATSSSSAPSSNTSTSTSTASSTTAASPTPKKMSWPTPPEMQIDKNKKYYATIDTSLGSFKVELFASESPLTVNSFCLFIPPGLLQRHYFPPHS